MRKLLMICSIILCTLSTTIFSQSIAEMKVSKDVLFLGERFIPKNITDKNGIICCGLLIKSNIERLSFDSNLGIIKFSKGNTGELIYISPDETEVYVYALDFMPLKIKLRSLGIKLKSQGLWQITIDKKLEEELIPIDILVKPNDARIKFDNKLLPKNGKYKFSKGNHSIQISKKGFITQKQLIEVNEHSTLFIYSLEKDTTKRNPIISKTANKKHVAKKANKSVDLMDPPELGSNIEMGVIREENKYKLKYFLHSKVNHIYIVSLKINSSGKEIDLENTDGDIGFVHSDNKSYEIVWEPTIEEILKLDLKFINFKITVKNGAYSNSTPLSMQNLIFNSNVFLFKKTNFDGHQATENSLFSEATSNLKVEFLSPAKLRKNETPLIIDDSVKIVGRLISNIDNWSVMVNQKNFIVDDNRFSGFVKLKTGKNQKRISVFNDDNYYLDTLIEIYKPNLSDPSIKINLSSIILDENNEYRTSKNNVQLSGNIECENFRSALLNNKPLKVIDNKFNIVQNLHNGENRIKLVVKNEQLSQNILQFNIISQLDEEGPDIEIISPNLAGNFSLKNKSINISAKISDPGGVEVVTLNEIPLKSKRNNIYSKRYKLRNGDNFFRFLATDSLGNPSYYNFKINFGRN